jgi:hypothetical protein
VTAGARVRLSETEYQVKHLTPNPRAAFDARLRRSGDERHTVGAGRRVCETAFKVDDGT